MKKVCVGKEQYALEKESMKRGGTSPGCDDRGYNVTFSGTSVVGNN